MTQSELLDFMRGHRWAVQTSVSGAGAPQAALVGIAVTDDLEIVFDTLDITRRVINLRSNPKIAFVVGDWHDGDERTAQYEGVADFPGRAELRHLKDIYFGKLNAGNRLVHRSSSERAQWLHVIAGDVSVSGETLNAGDGAAIGQVPHLWACRQRIPGDGDYRSRVARGWIRRSGDRAVGCDRRLVRRGRRPRAGEGPREKHT